MSRSIAFRVGFLTGPFLFLAAMLVLVTGCAHVPPPEPVVRTVEVSVPVYRPCPALQRLGPAPVYPDDNAALRSAPDIAARVGLLLAGRVLRTARLEAVEAALRACGE